MGHKQRAGQANSQKTNIKVGITFGGRSKLRVANLKLKQYVHSTLETQDENVYTQEPKKGILITSHIFRSIGKESAFFAKLVEQGRLGVKTSKGIYDYGGQSESEVLKKRDMFFIKMLDYLKEINAFEPVWMTYTTVFTLLCL